MRTLTRAAGTRICKSAAGISGTPVGVCRRWLPLLWAIGQTSAKALKMRLHTSTLKSTLKPILNPYNMFDVQGVAAARSMVDDYMASLQTRSLAAAADRQGPAVSPRGGAPAGAPAAGGAPALQPVSAMDAPCAAAYLMLWQNCARTNCPASLSLRC